MRSFLTNFCHPNVFATQQYLDRFICSLLINLPNFVWSALFYFLLGYLRFPCFRPRWSLSNHSSSLLLLLYWLLSSSPLPYIASLSFLFHQLLCAFQSNFHRLLCSVLPVLVSPCFSLLFVCPCFYLTIVCPYFAIPPQCLCITFPCILSLVTLFMVLKVSSNLNLVLSFAHIPITWLSLSLPYPRLPMPCFCLIIGCPSLSMCLSLSDHRFFLPLNSFHLYHSYNIGVHSFLAASFPHGCFFTPKYIIA